MRREEEEEDTTLKPTQSTITSDRNTEKAWIGICFTKRSGNEPFWVFLCLQTTCNQDKKTKTIYPCNQKPPGFIRSMFNLHDQTRQLFSEYVTCCCTDVIREALKGRHIPSRFIVSSSSYSCFPACQVGVTQQCILFVPIPLKR